MLMLDVDYVLSKNFLEKHAIDDTRFISGDGNKDERSGLVYLTKKHFNIVNGYNENLMYWGYADTDLYNRLSKAGFIQEYADLNYVIHLPHSHSMSLNNQMSLNNLIDKRILIPFNRQLCNSIPWNTQSNRIKWLLNHTDHPNRFLAIRNLQRDGI